MPSAGAINQQPEYMKMLLSSLLVLYSIQPKDVLIYEEDSELSDDENTASLIDEALLRAPNLNEVFSLFKKGSASNK